MHLIARVFDVEITEEDLLEESVTLYGQDSLEGLKRALDLLINRYLLYHQALLNGFEVSEEEFENALLEALDSDNSVVNNEHTASEIEKQIEQCILIRKYIQQLYPSDLDIPESQLLAYYEEQQENFSASEMVRASHILIRKDEANAEDKAKKLREKIHSPEVFKSICTQYSQCPSGIHCGDLGWFPRGKMIKEIEDIAFALQPGEISEVFPTKYGYHILMVTDRRESRPIPFEDIRESLETSLNEFKKEFFLFQHIQELHNTYKDQIVILDENYL
ncbi:MAG: peptidylprolyl isomerase [Candidatus Cloacimonadaceae bacterium]|jgi:parvulin-like peptidyl-prolyl isomerase|nr:peptidylprolyl isomerase [Candidatus Cloacimonadota bacterium]MDY0112033.1 peptidylprolyl isomerase [Candidatus Syntrophosphaera sp.]